MNGFLHTATNGAPSKEWLNEDREYKLGACVSLECASVDWKGGSVPVWGLIVCD